MKPLAALLLVMLTGCGQAQTAKHFPTKASSKEVVGQNCEPGQTSNQLEFTAEPGGVWQTYSSVVWEDGKFVFADQIKAALKEIAEAQAKEDARLKENADLVRAAETRILTTKEFDELVEKGVAVLDDGTRYMWSTSSGSPSSEAGYQLILHQRYDELIAQQFRLRKIASWEPKP